MVGGTNFNRASSTAPPGPALTGLHLKLFDYTAAVKAGVKPEDIFIDKKSAGVATARKTSATSISAR